MSFLDELKKQTNRTYTLNEAPTNNSTLSPVLDLFAQGGAMRERKEDAIRLFRKAFAKDPLMALKILFYLRDVRGGQGERTLFRECLQFIPTETISKNIKNIPEFGRFDDLLVLDTNLIIEFIKEQLKSDEEQMIKNEKVSLLAKWLPSENTSSKNSVLKAKEILKGLGLKPAQYRKKLSKLRKYIDILERKMSKKDWTEINYEKIPSQALRKHVKAFKRNDEKRYDKYLEQVENGEKKINTKTLYTYEIFDLVKEDEKTANAMWKNLPDYTNGKNALVVADVSGSMSGRPMSVSVSLALYFAERNKGAFHNYFMTFSNKPQLIEVTGKNLVDKLNFIENAHWEQNTNLEAVFDTLLSSGLKNKEEMPKVIYIISDMEFDNCISGCDETVFENAKRKFNQADFELPHIVFWNVDSKTDQSPATIYDHNVTLISGLSQNTFRYAVEGKTPVELMNEVLNSERYNVINI